MRSPFLGCRSVGAAGRSAQDVVRDAVRFCAFVGKREADRAEAQALANASSPLSASTVAGTPPDAPSSPRRAPAPPPDCADHDKNPPVDLPSGLRWRQALFSADTMLCLEMTMGGANDDFRIQALGRGAKRMLPNAATSAGRVGQSLVQYVHPEDILTLKARAHQLEQRCLATPRTKVVSSDSARIRLASFEGGSAGVIAGGSARKYVTVEMQLLCGGEYDIKNANEHAEVGEKRTLDGEILMPQAVRVKKEEGVGVVNYSNDGTVILLEVDATLSKPTSPPRRIVLMASFDQSNLHTHMHASQSWMLENAHALPEVPLSSPEHKHTRRQTQSHTHHSEFSCGFFFPVKTPGRDRSAWAISVPVTLTLKLSTGSSSSDR